MHLKYCTPQIVWFVFILRPLPNSWSIILNNPSFEYCYFLIVGVLAFYFFSGDLAEAIPIKFISEYLTDQKPTLNFYLIPVIVSCVVNEAFSLDLCWFGFCGVYLFVVFCVCFMVEILLKTVRYCQMII
jgi:hypothetical protein